MGAQSMTQETGGDLGAFDAAQGQALLRFTFLLTGGHAAQAEDLLQTVLARIAVRGLADIDDPVAYAPSLVTDDQITMLEALMRLSERERCVVVLRYYEDLPDDEIAQVLGCSRSTVRSLVHRALPKLRVELGETCSADPAARSTQERAESD